MWKDFLDKPPRHQEKEASTPNSAMVAQRALGVLLRQQSSYGSVLFLGLCDIWGPEWLDYEPKTVQLELRDTFGFDIDPDQFDKIMAARQVVTTDFCFKELPAFITCINALSGDGCDTPFAQPIEPGDLAWSVLEMVLLYPPNGNEQFSEEIIGFMEETLRWQGIQGVPQALIQFLPEATWDETLGNDPDGMELVMGRLAEINEEVVSNMRAWRFQLSRLRLVNGSVKGLLERFEELK